MSMTLFFTPRFKFKSAVLGAALLVAPAACNAVQDRPAAPASAAEAKAPVTVTYQQGQLISIITSLPNSGEAAREAIAAYGASAFPLASTHGLKREGQLLVKAAPVGDHKPVVAIFYSWPSAAAEAAFNAEPAWPAIRDTRADAWEELRIYTDLVEKDMTLTFDPAKTYTLAMAWINPENPHDYDVYMKGIEPAVAQSGGRFMYKMSDPEFESHSLDAGAPGQVTLVEWDTPQGLENFGKTKGFKDNAKYLSSGVTRFEIIALGVS